MKIPQNKKLKEIEPSIEGLQELIDLSPDIFFRIDLSGNLEYLSPSAEREGIKDKWNEKGPASWFNNPDNKESLKKIIDLAKQGEVITPSMLKVIGQEGQEIIFEVHGKPIHENGEVVAYSGIARELSRPKELEASLKKQKKRAEREQELAAQVHLTLIPKNLENANVSIGINYLPVSGVGGDYTNYKVLSDGNIIFVIGDVTGHGVAAALLVNRLDSEFERLAKGNPRPGRLLSKLNNFIKENFKGTKMFLSAFCGFLNFETMQLTYSNYGHPPQFLFQAKESNIISLKAQTHLLGLSNQKQNVKFEKVIDIKQGDRIVCFTDGLIEADKPNFEMYGYGRLKEFIIRNKSLPIFEFNKKLIDEVKEFSRQGFDDDTCVLSIHMKNGEE